MLLWEFILLQQKSSLPCVKVNHNASVNYFYLHGFASSPQSAKATYLRERFAAIQIELPTPDLNQGDFANLTLTRNINQVEAEFPSGVPITLIGSSLGGITAAWLGQRNLQVQRLILLAPAFQFLIHWCQVLGAEKLQRWQLEQYMPVYHYGKKRPLKLSYEFFLDALRYRDEELLRPVPTLILHGRYDQVVGIQASRDFACRSWVELIELDSDHGLGNVLPDIWQAIQVFCQLP